MAQDKEPNSGYRNPNGNLSVEEMREIGNLLEYVKIPLRNRKCLSKSSMGFRTELCFYCESHALACMELINTK